LSGGILGISSLSCNKILHFGVTFIIYIKISAHAAARAAERGITKEGIWAILAERPMVYIPSKSDPNVRIVLGKYENNAWGVVYNNEDMNVVTVRRAHNIERKYYEEKKRNRPDIL
jgi:uncharacterized DUF497 family protein